VDECFRHVQRTNVATTSLRELYASTSLRVLWRQTASSLSPWEQRTLRQHANKRLRQLRILIKCICNEQKLVVCEKSASTIDHTLRKIGGRKSCTFYTRLRQIPTCRECVVAADWATELAPSQLRRGSVACGPDSARHGHVAC